MSLLFSSRSEYHDITVQDRDGVRELRFGGRLQGSVDVATLSNSRAPYIDYLHLPLAFVPNARRTLVVGLGGGVLPKRFHDDYPSMIVDVVELDPVVVDVARVYFGFAEDDRLHVMVGDGREYMASAATTYDVIVVDAYFETFMPFAFVTREFFEIARARLAQGGAIAFNTVGRVEGPGSQALWRLFAGLHSVFPDLTLFAVGKSLNQDPGRTNIVAVASLVQRPVAEVEARIRSGVGGLVTVPGFASSADEIIELPRDWSAWTPYEDDEAPEDGLLKA